MKKLIKLSLVAVAIITLVSCGGKSSTPEAVAEKFLDHLNKQEYAEAKKLGTEATGEYLDMLASLSEMAPEEEVETPEITDLTCEENEDKATCTYKTDGQTQTINLVKQDDKWLVNMTKENPMDDIDMDFDDEIEEIADEVEEEMEVEEVVE